MGMANVNGPIGPFIKSYPMTLCWSGWSANTFELQREGWQLAASQNVFDQTLQIILKNEYYKLYMQSETVKINYFETYGNGYRNLDFLQNIKIPIASVGCKYIINSIENSFSHLKSFKPIDAEPQFINTEPKNIEDFMIFAPALIRTKEIIVPEENVDNLLARILELQDPMAKKYYEEQVKKNKSEANFDVKPRNNFVAQIISLQDYRKAA